MHTKRCSISSVIREIQINTTVRYYFTSTRIVLALIIIIIISVGKDVEKLEPSYIAGGNVKRYS